MMTDKEKRELSEWWAKEWGWEEIVKPIKNKYASMTYHYWKEGGECGSATCHDSGLVARVLSPDGMLKAWEYAESEGWTISLSYGSVWFWNHDPMLPSKETKHYQATGKDIITPIMLASQEAAKAVKG